ncbi:MAG: 16S rRNA (uracil(1498)-N(3))-methyltransferase [Verrucomicrobiales bacterium]
MSTHRFYIEPGKWNPDDLVLAGAEAHHCVEVVRCGVGDKITVFNGQGAEATAEILEIGKTGLRLGAMIHSRSEPLPVRIALGQAIPKGKNMEFIIQKATELGARRLFPLLSERSVVRLDQAERERKHEKWKRIALEAAKQSGQNWLPEVAAPDTPEKFFAREAGGFDLMLIASLQADAAHFKTVLEEHNELHGHGPASVLVLIGPEGDFTPAEIALARTAGCLPVTLGPIVLRTETAALYSLSVLAHELF